MGCARGHSQPPTVNAFLIDVAGQDESRLHDPESALNNPSRDAVTLRIVEIDLSTLETLQAPTLSRGTYLPVDRPKPPQRLRQD